MQEYYCSFEEANNLLDYLKNSKFFRRPFKDDLSLITEDKYSVVCFNIEQHTLTLCIGGHFSLNKYYIEDWDRYRKRYSIEQFIDRLSLEAKKEIIFNLDLFTGISNAAT